MIGSCHCEYALNLHVGRDALIKEIQEHDVTVLVGETGSGKTTRTHVVCPQIFEYITANSTTEVPQYLLESGIAAKGTIAVTQPRRVAATSLAARVAAEKNTEVGKLVGYSVRFDEAYCEETRIKYVTDGMLVRELLSDPLLSRYSIIIVDEAHERTLRTDILLANLKNILRVRNQPQDRKGKGRAAAMDPLKLVIMSATLDAEKFSAFFDKYVRPVSAYVPNSENIVSAKVLYIRGRQHAVRLAKSGSSYIATIQ